MSCSVFTSASEKTAPSAPVLLITAMAPMVEPWSSMCRMGKHKSDLMGPPVALSNAGSLRLGSPGVCLNVPCVPSRIVVPMMAVSRRMHEALSPGPKHQISSRMSSPKSIRQIDASSTLQTSCDSASTYCATLVSAEESTLRNLIRGLYSPASLEAFLLVWLSANVTLIISPSANVTLLSSWLLLSPTTLNLLKCCSAGCSWSSPCSARSFGSSSPASSAWSHVLRRTGRPSLRIRGHGACGATACAWRTCDGLSPKLARSSAASSSLLSGLVVELLGLERGLELELLGRSTALILVTGLSSPGCATP
mmetsp:Transcript_120822/g.352954  ORF Transcript_120822/g.352954 Transcript_120822/m.352954 type:complete len:308 (-) Transcript_120822:242-1165(-)